MKIKFIFITLFACMLLAISVHAHVPGYQVTAVSGSVPTIDGFINPTHDPYEWADASIVNFDSITVYVKHYEWGGFVQVFVAFHVPDITPDEDDNVMVSIDGWNDDGSPPNAPKWEDDVRCILTRGNLRFEEQGSAPPGNWVPIIVESHCGGVAHDFALGYWEAEFEITYDNQMLIPHQTNGFMLKVFDTFVGKKSWPPSPNGDEFDLSTWGDLLWPALPGDLVAQVGENSPEDHGWYYDPDADPYNEMLQLSLTAGPESVIVNSLTLRASGTGNDAIDVDTVYVFHDQNGNGRFDSGEPVKGSGSYAVDNGQLTISMGGHIIPAGNTQYFVIAYTMSMNAPIGSTYWFTLNSISAMGADSGQLIRVTGLPIISAVKTITASQTGIRPGSSNPGDHNWYYDPQADPYNEMLQFDFSATNGANVQINSVTVKASGTGNDNEDISTVYLVLDSNDNGIYDTADTLLVSGSYATNDGTLWLSLGTNPLVVPAGTSVHLLIAYGMTSSSSVGDTYKVQVIAINAVNLNSGAQETVNGLPITSGTKTTVSGPTPGVCSGILSIDLSPSTVGAGESVTATVLGLSQCTNKIVNVKAYSCYGTVICGIRLLTGSDGTCTFSAPSYVGVYPYYACLDINQDGDIGDPGEQAFDLIQVTSGGTNCAITNCGGCTDESTCTGAGCNWCDNVCQPGACEGENISDNGNGGNGDGGEPAPTDWTLYVVLIAAVILAGFGMLAFALYSTKRPRRR